MIVHHFIVVVLPLPCRSIIVIPCERCLVDVSTTSRAQHNRCPSLSLPKTSFPPPTLSIPAIAPPPKIHGTNDVAIPVAVVGNAVVLIVIVVVVFGMDRIGLDSCQILTPLSGLLDRNFSRIHKTTRYTSPSNHVEPPQHFVEKSHVGCRRRHHSDENDAT